MSIPCGARDGTALTQRRYRRLSRCANHRPYARGPNGENALRSLPDVALLPSRANLGTPAADPSTSGSARLVVFRRYDAARFVRTEYQRSTASRRYQ